MNRRRFLRAAGGWCFGLALLTGAGSAIAQSRLTGTVKRRNGQPLSNANIEFEPGGYVAISDRNGRFVVHNFVAGAYRITVRQGGTYQTLEMDIGDQADLRVNW